MKKIAEIAKIIIGIVIILGVTLANNPRYYKTDSSIEE